MSRRRASSVEVNDEENTPLQGGEYGDQKEPSYVGNGSVFAKLFAKETRHHAAVGGETHVEARENGEFSSNPAGLNGEYDDEADGSGFDGGLDAEDDEEDDEYDPNEASDSEDSGESDDADSDLDDEETSMRSLLLPMATYAKQLLFLSDDTGEFDGQDAELWASEDEKRAWIAQYEAKNREYVEQYGCPIDSSALPDAKRKLRRERKRETRYSIVLVVLAVTYFIRLMVGAPSSTVTVTPADTPAELPEPEKPRTMPGTTQAQVKDANAPVWWTVWTENLVVRVVTWPSQYFKSKTEVVRVKQPAQSHPVKPEGEPVVPVSPPPSTEPAPAEAEPTIVINEEEVETIEHDEEATRQEENVAEAHVDVALNDEAQTTPATVDTATTTVELVVETNIVEVEVVVESVASHDETPRSQSVEENVSVEGTESVEAHQPEDQAVTPQSTTSQLLSQCFGLFHKLIKTKNDPGLKVTAIEACDAAVQSASASQDSSTEWIQAHVLRGDLKSLLYDFDDARSDYETALTHAQTTNLRPDSCDMIELKLAANHWIELYQTKKFKELRTECERVVGVSSTQLSISREHLQGVASDWLRVFKREKPLLDVLIKTRAWTINPLKLH